MNTHQQLKPNHSSEFNLNVDIVFSKENNEKYKKELIKWVEREYLSRYFEMSLHAKVRELPSITSTWSDLPSSKSNAFSSKTENAALKKVIASEWVERFHKCLSLLPPLHQQIISYKYLNYDRAGRNPADIDVYSDLHMSRTNFYLFKKEALYLLAINLLGEEERID